MFQYHPNRSQHETWSFLGVLEIRNLLSSSASSCNCRDPKISWKIHNFIFTEKTTKTSTFAILRTRSSINQSFFLVARRSSIYQAVSLFPVAQFRMKKIPAQNYPQSSDHWMNSITPIGSMEMIYVPTFIIKINQSWLILIANVGKYFISMDASWDCGFGFSWFNLRTWPCQSISRSLGFISEPELSAPGGIFRGPWKNYRLYGCFLTWWYPPFHTPPLYGLYFKVTVSGSTQPHGKLAFFVHLSKMKLA